MNDKNSIKKIIIVIANFIFFSVKYPSNKKY